MMMCAAGCLCGMKLSWWRIGPQHTEHAK
jgi:hypothetical protein